MSSKAVEPLVPPRGTQNEPDLSDIPETDFRRASRNPYVVVLAPDVRKLFPTTEAVNDALRAYARSRNA